METQQFREVREFYAKTLALYGRGYDEPLAWAFGTVRREAFLPAGPWKIVLFPQNQETVIETPSADPIHLYRDALVALDAEAGINNGQPSLHAAWMGVLALKAGEHVLHIGAGRGYYSAVLAELVGSSGRVIAFEINARLGAAAREHLATYANVSVVVDDALKASLPPADIVYVNAGVIAPPLAWIEALRVGGRLICPWRPSEEIGAALLITRQDEGLAARMVGRAWFIPCVGGFDDQAIGPPPDLAGVREIRSVRLTSREAPDETAIATYRDLWFSSAAI